MQVKEKDNVRISNTLVDINNKREFMTFIILGLLNIVFKAIDFSNIGCIGPIDNITHILNSSSNASNIDFELGRNILITEELLKSNI